MAIELFVSPNYKEPKLPKAKRMSTASKKAKGRWLQDYVRDQLREIGKSFGLSDDDIKSAIMGTSGVDTVLSPAARRVFPFDIECKNVEKISILPVFRRHFEKYAKNDSIKLVVHKQNRKDPIVLIRATDFFELVRKALNSNAVPGHAVGEHDVA